MSNGNGGPDDPLEGQYGGIDESILKMLRKYRRLGRLKGIKIRTPNYMAAAKLRGLGDFTKKDTEEGYD